MVFKLENIQGYAYFYTPRLLFPPSKKPEPDIFTILLPINNFCMLFHGTIFSTSGNTASTTEI